MTGQLGCCSCQSESEEFAVVAGQLGGGVLRLRRSTCCRPSLLQEPLFISNRPFARLMFTQSDFVFRPFSNSAYGMREEGPGSVGLLPVRRSNIPGIDLQMMCRSSKTSKDHVVVAPVCK